MHGKRVVKKQGCLVPVLVLLLLLASGIVYHHFWHGTPSEKAAFPVHDAAQTPKTEDIVTQTDVVFAPSEAFSLTTGQQALLEDFMEAWYTAIGSFAEPKFTALFTHEEAASRHAASCRTLNAIRARAAEDLRLRSCSVALTVTDMQYDTPDGDVILEVNENAVMRFAGLPVDSELLSLPHRFVLRETQNDAWTIVQHEADDNPYFSLRYEEGADTDIRLDVFLRNIERRRLLQQQETTVVTLSCDRPYDRDAALHYMTEYCGKRNEQWYAYDEVGGNCMNFGSQVLLAGGIPMDEQGAERWYWHSTNRLDPSFINVGNFLRYARDNEGYGLVADIDAGYATGEIGDIIIFGVNGPNHTTVICDVLRDDNGAVIDYLLCSNTTNYRNFPAGAYYYTNQRLVKIFGWNT